MLVHVEQEGGSHVRHSLHVANVGAVHGEGLKNPLQLVVVDATHFEEAKHREGSGDISFNYADALLSRGVIGGRVCNQEVYLGLDSVKLLIQIFEPGGPLGRQVFAGRKVSVGSLAAAASYIDDLLIELRQVFEQLAQLGPTVGHDLVEFFRYGIAVAEGVEPDLASDYRRQAFDPEFSNPLGPLELVPVRENVLLPDVLQVVHSLLATILLDLLLLLGALSFTHLLHVEFAVFFDQLLMLSFLLGGFLRQV